MCNKKWDSELQTMVATDDCGKCTCGTSSATHNYSNGVCTKCSDGAGQATDTRPK